MWPRTSDEGGRDNQAHEALRALVRLIARSAARDLHSSGQSDCKDKADTSPGAVR
jgi:hypothetical protein